MSFLARNEYLLSEIDYYHAQICARLTQDAWSQNYREIWNTVCFQLNWYGYPTAEPPRDSVVRRLLGYTRYGRFWSVDSPVLNSAIALSKDTAVPCRTLFGFDLYTTGLGSGELFAHGVLDRSGTLVVLRLMPYLLQFIEVGAGNGYFSFLAAQQGLPVVAIEPAVGEYGRLAAGVERNGFGNITALPCSLENRSDGLGYSIESGKAGKELELGDYRAAGSLVRIDAPGAALSLLRRAGDWLAAYDAPVLLLETGCATAQETGLILSELNGRDYLIYAVNRTPKHQGTPLLPGDEPACRLTSSFLALPPMAGDMADLLSRPVDMRVFTLTEKLENLCHFVKGSFEVLCGG